ncbi:MAG: starvation-inducible outer membrane lipoprotein [Cryomorphaceae bacterium]|jgi:starvation-inducible outer membrane lipoprotein
MNTRLSLGLRNYLQPLVLLFLSLSLAACASFGSSYSSKTSPQISYAPAIDVPYDAVAKDIAQHVGTLVRWGGQIVKSRDVGNAPELTVFAYPLDLSGKPNRNGDNDYDGGRFVVQIENQDLQNAQLQDRFVTVYGRVTGELKIANGPLEKSLPIVDALEVEDWQYRDPRRYADIQLGVAYHGLGFRYGNGYSQRYGFYRSPYYGYNYSYYPSYKSYGHRRHHRRH